MKAKLILFVVMFALMFALNYFFATDRDIGGMVFVSIGVALIGSLTSDIMLRLVVKGVKKIVRPKPIE
jgi:hypothetical protein